MGSKLSLNFAWPSGRALAELGRVSNLPTCVSAASAGFYLGGGDPWKDPSHWFMGCFSVICFYEAGMVLNDWIDQDIDAHERPHRPIPSGRVRPSHAMILFIFLFVLGLWSVFWSFPLGLGLALTLILAIVGYHLTHQRWKASVLLLGVCRGLIYPLGACAAGWQPQFPEWWRLPVEMGLYVAVLSILAREEMATAISPFKKGAPLLAASVWFLEGQSWIQGDFLVSLSLWVPMAWMLLLGHRLLTQKIPLQKGVGGMLAGISLWDGAIIANCPSESGLILAWSCFFITLLSHRKIRGT